MKYFAILPLLLAAPASAEFAVEDQTPSGKFTTAGEIKQIVELTKPNWVAVREYNGKDWIYLTQLLSWRCGMHEIRYAINGGDMQVWDMPRCHLDSATPNAFPNDDALRASKTFPLGSVETVTIEVLFDDMSETRAQFDRNSVILP